MAIADDKNARHRAGFQADVQADIQAGGHVVNHVVWRARILTDLPVVLGMVAIYLFAILF